MVYAIRVYIPHGVSNSVKDRTIEDMVNECGGCTVHNAEGHWDSGESIVREPVKILESVTEDMGQNEAKCFALQLALDVKLRSNEDSVMWEVRVFPKVGFA